MTVFLSGSLFTLRKLPILTFGRPKWGQIWPHFYLITFFFKSDGPDVLILSLPSKNSKYNRFESSDIIPRYPFGTLVTTFLLPKLTNWPFWRRYPLLVMLAIEHFKTPKYITRTKFSSICNIAWPVMREIRGSAGTSEKNCMGSVQRA